MRKHWTSKKVSASFTVESSFVMIASLLIIFLVITTTITLENKASDFAKEKIQLEERVSDEMTGRSDEEIYERAPSFLYRNRIIKDFTR